jgi:SH3-like domain-containing protein
VGLASGDADARGRDRPTPSGLPVPRWVSLKHGKVNARSGPGRDYPAAWTYTAKGLPLQVIAETREWRKVCDPEGAVGWVHRNGLGGDLMVFRQKPGPLPLLSRPGSDGKVKAYLSPRAVASLDKCAKGWCRIRVDRVQGWAPARELWGVGDAPRCR